MDWEADYCVIKHSCQLFRREDSTPNVCVCVDSGITQQLIPLSNFNLIKILFFFLMYSFIFSLNFLSAHYFSLPSLHPSPPPSFLFLIFYYYFFTPLSIEPLSPLHSLASCLHSQQLRWALLVERCRPACLINKDNVRDCFSAGVLMRELWKLCCVSLCSLLISVRRLKPALDDCLVLPRQF